MNIKQKIFIILTSMILLSATALAVPQSDSNAGTSSKRPQLLLFLHIPPLDTHR